MEEDPKHHDFDQRHDGPFDQPRPSLSGLRRRSSKNDANAPMAAMAAMARSVSEPEGGFSTATRPTGRKSMPNTAAVNDASSPIGVGRSSTQMSRAKRPSKDFDTRRDGPFGRPSLTMQRRQSSGLALSPQATAESDGELVEQARRDEESRGRDTTEAPSPPSVDTMQSSNDAAYEPEPPPLNYSLWDRKWSIVIFWGFIVIDCTAAPIGLYFGLWYGTNLSPNTVFSIVTAALGGVSILEYVVRFRRLFRKGSTCRVIGARRSYLDAFHWNFSLGWVVIMVELIVGTIPEHPPIRLLAMPLVSMLYAFGTELIIVDIARYFEIPAPVRISSVPKGSQLRPGIYSIIEDVCAVDGSGGTAFREALNKRYEASHIFRAMLRRLGFFWAAGAEGCAVLCTVLIFTIQHEAAYCVGWSVPFIWAGSWALATYFYVVRKLAEEQKAWTEEVAMKMSV